MCKAEVTVYLVRSLLTPEGVSDIFEVIENHGRKRREYSRFEIRLGILHTALTASTSPNMGLYIPAVKWKKRKTSYS